MTTTTVYEALAAVLRDVGAVTKARRSQAAGNYAYRGIDDVVNALAQPVRDHGLLIVPNVITHETAQTGKPGWTETRLVVEYHVFGPDGSTLPTPVRVFAIGIDNGDKGPGKALSYAYKSAMSQLFCLPTEDDALDNEHSAEYEKADTAPRADPDTVREIVDAFDALPEHSRGEAKAEFVRLWGRPDNIEAALAADALTSALDIIHNYQETQS